MKSSEFDEKFDDDVDILEDLDLSKAKRSAQTTKRVNVDFPSGCWNRLTERQVELVSLVNRLSKSGSQRRLKPFILILSNTAKP